MRIAFFNPQGNFDKESSRLTEHPDFGGQLIYVREVAMELSKLGVDVDIFTRKIVDDHWPEFMGDFDSYEGYDNLRIIRIPFGGNKFLRKELLWPYFQRLQCQTISRHFRHSLHIYNYWWFFWRYSGILSNVF